MVSVLIAAAMVVSSCFDFEENQIELKFVNDSDVDLCYFAGSEQHIAEACARIDAQSERVWSHGCGPGDLSVKAPVVVTITERASGNVVSEHVGECSEWLDSPPVFAISQNDGQLVVNQQ